MSIILETRDLTIGYKARRQPLHTVATHLNLQMRAGELVCLLGPNGAGKSTLMRTLSGMQPPLSGHVRLAGRDLTTYSAHELAKTLSLVLTERVNVGLLSAYALVALGRYPYTNWQGRLTPHDETIVRRAIEAVGATSLATRPVSELSDGERQKVMIARALAQEPRLMLLDEPTAFLDLPRRVEIMTMLRRLAHEHHCAILLSTHDLDLALRGADTLWVLNQGKLHVGAPEDLVLSGAFAEAFASEGVQFDPYSGGFYMHSTPRGTIEVRGEGLPALWAARAVERVGYRVVTAGAGAGMVVVASETGWCLEVDDNSSHYTSLGMLVHNLQCLS